MARILRPSVVARTGCSAAWQRACFGSRRSGVQIPASRRGAVDPISRLTADDRSHGGANDAEQTRTSPLILAQGRSPVAGEPPFHDDPAKEWDPADARTCHVDVAAPGRSGTAHGLSAERAVPGTRLVADGQRRHPRATRQRLPPLRPRGKPLRAANAWRPQRTPQAPADPPRAGRWSF